MRSQFCTAEALAAQMQGQRNVSMLTAPRQMAVSKPSTEVLRSDDEQAFDDFVHRHAAGTPFHLCAWKRTIVETYGYAPYYLVARTGDLIRGILPLFLVNNWILGKALISSPFAVYGGILAGDDDARIALYNHARALGESLGVDYIELRNAYPEQCVGTSNVSLYVGFTQPLTPDDEELMRSLPKKTRNMVRKSQRTAFSLRRTHDTTHLYALMTRNMRRLGTPSFSRKYFDNVIRNFGPEQVDVREVWSDGIVMAAGMNFLFRRDMHTYHASADTRFNDLGPNTFMYYENLRWAGQNGYTTFDFGRSKRGTGPYEFKRHWNTTMRELPYEIVLIRRKQLPNLNPANPKMRLPIQLWSRLPLALTRAIGPTVVRWFP